MPKRLKTAALEESSKGVRNGVGSPQEGTWAIHLNITFCLYTPKPNGHYREPLPSTPNDTKLQKAGLSSTSTNSPMSRFITLLYFLLFFWRGVWTTSHIYAQNINPEHKHR